MQIPYSHRSEGFALTGYDIPGCVEDGAWMLWENSSVVAVVVAAVAVARSFLGIFVKTRFFTNGLHMEDGELIMPAKFTS